LQEYLVDIFGSFGRIIVFFHVISAALLIGSMATIRLVIKPMLEDIKNERIRCNTSLKIFDRYVYFIIIILLVIVSASFMMNIGLGFKYANPITYSMLTVKEFIWVFVTFNFIYMYMRYKAARESGKKRDFFEANENISIIIDYLIPLNLVLSFSAVYVGIGIRGL
jgi:uncharacterized membrane protein